MPKGHDQRDPDDVLDQDNAQRVSKDIPLKENSQRDPEEVLPKGDDKRDSQDVKREVAAALAEVVVTGKAAAEKASCHKRAADSCGSSYKMFRWVAFYLSLAYLFIIFFNTHLYFAYPFLPE